MADRLEQHLVTIEKDLGGDGKLPKNYEQIDKLDWHLNKIEDLLEEGGGGTTVIANPTLEGDEPDLTGLEIGENKFAVPPRVSANPTLEGTEVALTGLEVEGVKYKIDGGNTVHVYHCQGGYSDPSSDFYYFTDNDDIDTIKKLNDDLKRRGYTLNSAYPVISRISIMTPQPNTDFRLLQSIYSTNDGTNMPLGRSTRWTLADGAFSCSLETIYISPVYIRKLI